MKSFSVQGPSSRRTLSVAAALTVTALAGGVPASATPADIGPRGDTHLVSADVRAPLTKQCRARLTRPKATVAPKTMAKCVLTAQTVARTAVIRTAYDDGSWGKGPYRFGRTTDAAVRMNDGMRLVALGKSFWVRYPGDSWVKGSAKGSSDARLAQVTGALWRSYATPQTYRRTLASASAWKPVGGVKRINGVRARAYDGDPKLPGVTTDSYRIWLDDRYLPVRIAATTTAHGFSTTMTQDFTRWGKKVSIKAPS